jgi:hypothetical protein
VPRLTDEELEYYGRLYLEHGIAEVITFESFLLDPDRYLHRRVRSAASRPRPGRWRSLLAVLGVRPLARSPHG